MLVTGQVELNTDGTVRSYALDKQDKLPAPVVDLSSAMWSPGNSSSRPPRNPSLPRQ